MFDFLTFKFKHGFLYFLSLMDIMRIYDMINFNFYEN